MDEEALEEVRVLGVFRRVVVVEVVQVRSETLGVGAGDLDASDQAAQRDALGRGDEGVGGRAHGPEHRGGVAIVPGCVGQDERLRQHRRRRRSTDSGIDIVVVVVIDHHRHHVRMTRGRRLPPRCRRGFYIHSSFFSFFVVVVVIVVLLDDE
jgi:hypothetical protein